MAIYQQDGIHDNPHLLKQLASLLKTKASRAHRNNYTQRYRQRRRDHGGPVPNANEVHAVALNNGVVAEEDEMIENDAGLVAEEYEIGLVAEEAEVGLVAEEDEIGLVAEEDQMINNDAGLVDGGK